MFVRIVVLVALLTCVSSVADAVEPSVSEPIHSEDPRVEIIFGPGASALHGTSFITKLGLVPAEGGLQYLDRHFLEGEAGSDDQPPGGLVTISPGLTYAPADVVELGLLVPIFVSGQRTAFDVLPFWITVGHSFETFDIGGRFMVDPISMNFTLGMPLSYRGESMILETGIFVPFAFRDNRGEFAVDLPVRLRFDAGSGFVGLESGFNHYEEGRETAQAIPLGVIAGLWADATQFTILVSFDRMLSFRDEFEVFGSSLRIGLGVNVAL